MKKVTIRVPATTANLGPGFDAFGCALSLYTDVTFEEMESGLEITGCDEVYAGPDNMVFAADPIISRMTRQQLQKGIDNTTKLMKEAAQNLDFIQAAQYRDEIIRLQKEMKEKD